ncbi:MAG TPA: cytochrome c1 [Devosia sp.]|jgi:ubiquinol-cytochrome c reductase cytochrome c1 subunit|nr:cytochrome c1 [Devosia sp.]
MIKTSTIFAAALMSLGLAALPALAQEAAPTEPVVKQHWSFAGPFGTFDKAQLQRGFQVFQTVCSNCHTARLLSFRNLSEPGGPEFSEGQVKALAATYNIADPEADGGKRKALPSDRWPGPDQSPADLRTAFGIVPPDLSVMAKARSVEDKFPNWLFNYFTTYAEGGPDYIHALLNGYVEPPPAGVEIPDGKHYNKVFPGHAIGMPPPLADGQVPYGKAEDGSTVPLTVDQYSRDVAAFLMWVAEPHLNETKAAGFRILTFLLLFAVLMWLVKQRVWRKVEH